ncbi:MAG: MBL fold metallo-hydrolase [Candidatus Margulisbacteria bacterium]|nr:MBL fold metallo-hydrolase [Candidatus Margulisiibacteriota bacterium]
MDFIKFLGTAGARVVVAKQLRASGGIWLSLDGTNILIDPGPGSLVHCMRSRPKLDPTTLEGIVITHKHLDHAADINVMMEAMTIGGKEKRGLVLAPKDALSGNDPVIYKYVRPYVSQIEVLRRKKKYKIGTLTITAPTRHQHGVETYGLIIKGKKRTIAYITDSRYFPGLADKYKADVVIISVLSIKPNPFDHLSIEDVRLIVGKLKPKTTILTHFGMWMLKARPWVVAEALKKELRQNIIAASDGMAFPL